SSSCHGLSPGKPTSSSSRERVRPCPVQRSHVRRADTFSLGCTNSPGRPPGHDEPVSCHLRCRLRVPEGTSYQELFSLADCCAGHESHHASPRHQAEVDRWDWLHVRDQEKPEKRS